LEQRWNEWESGKLKYWENNIIECVCGMWKNEWSKSGLILRGENIITGRKIRYDVGGRWKNEWSNGGMFQGLGNRNIGEQHFRLCVVCATMCGKMVE